MTSNNNDSERKTIALSSFRILSIQRKQFDALKKNSPVRIETQRNLPLLRGNCGVNGSWLQKCEKNPYLAKNFSKIRVGLASRDLSRRDSHHQSVDS